MKDGKGKVKVNTTQHRVEHSIVEPDRIITSGSYQKSFALLLLYTSSVMIFLSPGTEKEIEIK